MRGELTKRGSTEIETGKLAQKQVLCRDPCEGRERTTQKFLEGAYQTSTQLFVHFWYKLIKDILFVEITTM